MSNRSSSKTPSRRGSVRHLSDEVLLAEIEVRHKNAETKKYAVLGLFLVLAILATAFPAWVLSGQTTVVQVNVVVTFTIAVTLAGLGSVAWGRKQKARADRLELRNVSLSRDVKELQQRLRDAGLPDDVSR